MRVKSLKNITNGRVKLKFASGVSAFLHPGSKIENVTITNEEELKGKVCIVADLTEVNEQGTKTKLND